jgi:hypothetical protein
VYHGYASWMRVAPPPLPPPPALVGTPYTEYLLPLSTPPYKPWTVSYHRNSTPPCKPSLHTVSYQLTPTRPSNSVSVVAWPRSFLHPLLLLSTIHLDHPSHQLLLHTRQAHEAALLHPGRKWASHYPCDRRDSMPLKGYADSFRAVLHWGARGAHSRSLRSAAKVHDELVVCLGVVFECAIAGTWPHTHAHAPQHTATRVQMRKQRTTQNFNAHGHPQHLSHPCIQPAQPPLSNRHPGTTYRARLASRTLSGAAHTGTPPFLWCPPPAHHAARSNASGGAASLQCTHVCRHVRAFASVRVCPNRKIGTNVKTPPTFHTHSTET